MRWESTIPSPGLGSDEMHLWYIPPLIGGMTDCEKTLSPEENTRVDRFRFGQDRRNYITAHVGLRRILAGYLGQLPTDIVYEYGPFGKPRVAGSPIEFSLSHSGELAVCAVTAGAAVGIDVERVNLELEAESVYRAHFPQAEVAWLDSLEGARRVEAFYSLWVQKEAYLKALGTGIIAGFTESPLDPAFIARNHPPAVDRFPEWAVRLEPPFFGAALAVAVRCLDPQLRYFDLQTETSG